MFPPALAPVLTDLLPEHPVLQWLGTEALSDVMTRLFFASLQTEERAHHPIRVALTGRPKVASELERQTPSWKYLPFRSPCPCTTRNLLRLARAAPSDRLFITVTQSAHEGLAITGLARAGFGPDEGMNVTLRAVAPGNLEVWVSGRRVLEYSQGSIQAPPEDLLLSSGIVRAKLLSFAAEAKAPAGYIESIASIIRHLADHPHGGILVLSAEDEPQLPPEAAFAPRGDRHLWELLQQLGWPSAGAPEQETTPATELYRTILRTEIERTLSELGRMTALDGATILDRYLGVQGFGIVLPVRPDLRVLEISNAAATHRRPFALDQYGARHRAAASYAATHPGSLVFIASATGGIGCMLREQHSESVMLWRFRSGDLASPAP
jgi:hypothetical protein